MKATSLPNQPADSFYDVYHSYLQQVSHQYDLPKSSCQEEVANQVNTSTLSADDQRGFHDWLAERCYLQMSIGNALRRGLLVEARLVSTTTGGKVAYSVRIEGL